MKRFFVPLLLLAILLLFIWWIFSIAEKPRPAASFEECVNAGNPVMESYPRQCRDATGALFREEILEPFPFGE